MPPDRSPQTQISRTLLEGYLQAFFDRPVRLLGLAPLGESLQAEVAKEFGYGKPVELEFEVGGELRRAVVHTIKPGPFGHEHMADRAAELLWSHDAFNTLPCHVRSLDVGALGPKDGMISLGQVRELFLLTEFAEGREYAHDLTRLRQEQALTQQDLDRADALCDYLIDIHRVRGTETGLYDRRIRELVGHGQCIMGLIDSYPSQHPWISPKFLESIEQQAVHWRWRLKGRSHRLAQVHGDFHPWNILFQEGTKFRLLDRSRGQWGDPADDVTALTMNYVFESLQASGRVQGAFLELFDRFWVRYLDRSADREILEVAAPFVAFRGLVMASPVWYPHIDDHVRRRMIGLVKATLDATVFDPQRIHEYLETDLQ